MTRVAVIATRRAAPNRLNSPVEKNPLSELELLRAVAGKPAATSVCLSPSSERNQPPWVFMSPKTFWPGCMYVTGGFAYG